MSASDVIKPATAPAAAPYPPYDPWRRIEGVTAVCAALAIGTASDVYLLVKFGWLVAILGAWLSGLLAGAAGLAVQLLFHAVRRAARD